MSEPMAGVDTYDALGARLPGDMVAQLRSIADMKPGDETPDWLGDPWGTALSKLCGDAAAEIERLRAIAGAVTPGLSLAELKSLHDLSRPQAAKP